MLELKTFWIIIYLVNFNVQIVDWIICVGVDTMPYKHVATKSPLEIFDEIRKPPNHKQFPANRVIQT
jgi:hypothetical protein